MKNNIVENHDMSGDMAGTWYKLADTNTSIDKFTLTINASNVTGTKDGTVDIYLSNDLVSSTPKGGVYATKTINSATYDAQVEVNFPYNKIKFVYSKNSITAGTLNVYIATVGGL